MIGTLVALVIAIFLHFSEIGRETLPNIGFLGIILITAGTIFLIFPALFLTISWIPVQKAEQNSTPRITELIGKDLHIKIALGILILFPILSYVIAIDVLSLGVFNRNNIVPFWIVLLGISIDAIYYLIKRISSYLDPFQVVEMLAKNAIAGIQQANEKTICNNIDAQSEIAIHAIDRQSTSLSLQSIDALQRTAKVFFESYKSISHPLKDDQDKSLGINDTISYTLFFLLQRLELINEKAASRKLEPICSSIITSTGKITFYAAKYDLSIATYSLQFLGKFALVSLKQGIKETGPKAIITFLTVAESILKDIDITYLELQDPFISLIDQMQEVTKEMFRQDKKIDLALLKKPFLDLKEMFKTEKLSSHQDTPVILQEIDRVLSEYDALAAVMRARPPIPTISEG
jgi:hypothetical protein